VSVLDRCRIRIGLVREVTGKWARVTCRPLTWDGSTLVPATEVEEQVRWAVDGLSLMSPPAPGDTVALHWDWVCDTLTPAQVDRIEMLEERQRAAVGLA